MIFKPDDFKYVPHHSIKRFHLILPEKYRGALSNHVNAMQQKPGPDLPGNSKPPQEKYQKRALRIVSIYSEKSLTRDSELSQKDKLLADDIAREMVQVEIETRLDMVR